MSGALDEGLEHRLDVSRRGGDHAQHVAGCRLVLAGLCEFLRSLREFLRPFCKLPRAGLLRFE